MAIDNSNVKIENGKVIFSQEVLEYFENLRTDENSKWIDKYFEVLSDSLNFNVEKFNLHHIRPCNTFKDKEHKNRKQTESLADEFNGNLIKLSIYNHIKAHYFLWKIFDNWDSRHAVQQMCELKKNIDELSENELIEIAKLKEECAKKNQTEEEKKKYNRNNSKKNYKNNKEIILKNMKEYYEDNREIISERRKKNRKEHEEEISKKRREHYMKNRDEILEKSKKYNASHKEQRSKYNKKYREENNERLKEHSKKYYYEHKEENKERSKERNKLWYKENKEYKNKKSKEYIMQKCIDPKRGDECSYNALLQRKIRNKEEYDGINPKDYIIKSKQL